MKKIVSALTAIMISCALLAQTPVNEKQTGGNKDQAPESKAVTLDGKTFKITFNIKSPTSSETGTVNTDKSTTDQTGMKVTSPEGKTDAEPVADKAPVNQQSQASLASLDRTSAKLMFSGETIKIILNNETPAVEGCAYRVTSGTADFATYSANCDRRAPMVPPVESKEMNENVKDAGATEISTDAPAVTSGSDMPAPATTNAMGNTNSVAAYITGLVNGNEISGTVIFKENGSRITYSYKGVAENRKGKKNDEMGMK